MTFHSIDAEIVRDRDRVPKSFIEQTTLTTVYLKRNEKMSDEFHEFQYFAKIYAILNRVSPKQKSKGEYLLLARDDKAFDYNEPRL